tara:strand:- start:1048 stop:2121 length:1074 start_codon:yes stop_codon:yes gene_type:complete
MSPMDYSREKILLGLSKTQLEHLVAELGQPSYRGRQLHDWLYVKGVRSLDEITVLPKDMRILLNKEGIQIGRLSEVERSVSSDETIKLLLGTHDGENVETVGIPTEKRLTVCVSSQVGCAMGCLFCATGKSGLQRSLAVNEIVDQVLSVREAMARRPSHVVFMGMGEPLMNLKSVLNAIYCLNKDLNIGQRKITVSTVGVANTLPILAENALAILGSVQFTLAVSLHAPNQEIREELIPSAKNYHINKLLNDCKNYNNKTGRRVSFEYILLGGVNDLPCHAEELASLLFDSKSHINLIAYNPIFEANYERPSSERIKNFMNILKNKGMMVTLRASRGLDSNAACGQLRSKNSLRNKI